jgi:hypothetical protein
VSILVCLEEEALGVLLPRRRATAAEFACLRGRDVQAAPQHADYHALPFSGMDQGNSLPY